MFVLIFYGVDIFMLLWEPKKRGKINYGCLGNADIVIWNFIKIIILNVINTSIITYFVLFCQNNRDRKERFGTHRFNIKCYVKY